MSTPIEALAQEYAADFYENKRGHCNCESDAEMCFMAGATAASGRVAELERQKQTMGEMLNHAEKFLIDRTMVSAEAYLQFKDEQRAIALSGAGKGEG